MTVSISSAQSPGNRMRAAVRQGQIKPFIGVYDVFSAALAGRHYDALFLSGFGFAASFYGLPDIGFITWSDMVSYVQRVRTVLPAHHLLVDIDDGYTDPDVACHVVSVLEASGASGVVLEDQKRPRRCGHFDGKQIMDLDEYLAKLRQVLATRRDLFVIARTDSSDPADIERRVARHEVGHWLGIRGHLGPGNTMAPTIGGTSEVLTHEDIAKLRANWR